MQILFQLTEKGIEPIKSETRTVFNYIKTIVQVGILSSFKKMFWEKNLKDMKIVQTYGVLSDVLLHVYIV